MLRMEDNYERTKQTTQGGTMTAIVEIGLGVSILFIVIEYLFNVYQIEKLHRDVRRLQRQVRGLRERLDSV